MADRVTERTHDKLAWMKHRHEILTREKALSVIRDTLKKRRLTQAWLSRELSQYPFHLDVSGQSLRGYFTGQTRIPHEVLAAICIILDLPLEDILASDVAAILLHAGPHRRGGPRPGAGRPKGKTA